MRDNRYFKRLDYRMQDIPRQSFSDIFFHTESKHAQYMPIDRFIELTSSEELTRIFTTEKSQREKNCGLGSLYTDEVQTKRNSGFYLKVEADSVGVTEKAEHSDQACTGMHTLSHTHNRTDKGITHEKMQDFFIRFQLDAAHPVLFDQSYIDIADHAAARLILYFDSAEVQSTEQPHTVQHRTTQKEAAQPDNKAAYPPQTYRNGLISIRIGKHAAVEIIKIQNFADTTFNFETVRMDVGEKASVTIHDIQLGSQKSGVSYSSYMQEDWSEVFIFPLYFVDKTRRMDIEHNLVVNGKNTLSEIKARGALKNSGYKVFRGNIFLNKGCSASIARFADNSIMLDKHAVSASIPTIFCDEDDVIGEHAASFAAIDKEKLYYLMSRGFDELSAKKLIIDAAFRPVFNTIPDAVLRNKINAEFDARLSEEVSETTGSTAGMRLNAEKSTQKVTYGAAPKIPDGKGVHHV